MPLTGLTVSLNRATYVRVDPAYAVIRALVTPAGTAPGTVTVTLSRRRYVGVDTLATRTLTFASLTPQEATFDLGALADAHGFPSAGRSRQIGDYQVTATLDGSPGITGSAPLSVLLVAPEVMRSRWLVGLPLTQTGRKMVRVQPQVVTGVRVVDVGTLAVSGAGTLTYTHSGKALTWRAGAAFASTPGVHQTTLVAAGNVNDYLVVEVDDAALPGSDKTETLIVDQATITDEDLARRIVGLVDEIERRLQVPLEPTRVVTRMLVDKNLAPASYDRVTDGRGWYQPSDLYRFINIQLALPMLLKIHALTGWLNQQKALVLDAGWMQINERLGEVNLIPSGSVSMQWLSESPFWPTMLYAQPYIPGWWQFDVTQGLREIPAGLLEHVSKLIAIDLLTSLGQARNPSGAAGLSLSRDGVSESRSLNPQGLYAATIQRYLDDTGQGRPGVGTSTEGWREMLIGIPVVIL